MSKRKDVESEQAAAKLQRLAEATALLRLYRESEGHDARSLDAVTAWAQRHPEIGNPVTPSEEDHIAAAREHPELAALARRSNPYLSGEN